MSLTLNEIARNDPRLLEPLKLFAAGKLNCVQTVLSPYLTDGSSDLADPVMGMTRYLGGGVADMGYVCGALLGAILALSHKLEKLGVSAEEGEKLISEFSREFGQQHDTVFCNDIKAQYSPENQYQACQVLVVNAIDAVDKIIAELEQKNN